MSNLFIKQKIVNYNSLLDMKEDNDGELVEALVSSKDSPNPEVDKSFRSTKVKKYIKPALYPEICKSLLELIPMFRPKFIKERYSVDEFNYLIYNEGDFFKKHRDQVPRRDGGPPRLISTSTLISQSDDFEGGELIVFNGEKAINTNLQVGETIMFDAAQCWHQVNPVKRGTREVLVAWIYLKHDVHSRKNLI